MIPRTILPLGLESVLTDSWEADFRVSMWAISITQIPMRRIEPERFPSAQATQLVNSIQQINPLQT